MYLLNQFARRKGSKDKNKRNRRLAIAGLTTLAIGGIALANKKNIIKLVKSKNTKPSTSQIIHTNELSVPSVINKKQLNTEKVQKRLELIKNEANNYKYGYERNYGVKANTKIGAKVPKNEHKLDRYERHNDRKKGIKEMVKLLKNKNAYLSSSVLLNTFRKLVATK